MKKIIFAYISTLLKYQLATLNIARCSFMLIRTLLIGLLFQPLVFATDGNLDTSFSGDGKIFMDIGSHPSYEQANDIVILEDGKILAIGSASNGSDDFAIVKYNPNGSLDTTFGNSGKVFTEFIGGYKDYAYSIAIQTDGKLVVGGSTQDGYNNPSFALARYNSNGSLDTTFDSDGKVVINLGSYDVIKSIAILDNGKILVGGHSNKNFTLLRYESNGSLDPTFGSNGKVITDFGGQDFIHSIIILNSGKFIAAGSTDNDGGLSHDFALARYNADGSIDTSFGNSGKVVTDFGTTSDSGESLAIQDDGKIILAGKTRYDFALARYNADGSLDTTFGSDGKVTTDFNGNDDSAYSVAIQNSGNIVAVGTDSSNFAVARYSPEDGNLDTTFGTNGKLTTDFNGGYDRALSIAIQGDGNIVVTGKAENSSGAYYSGFALARYESAPCLSGYQLQQGGTTCIPAVTASDPGDYPNIVSRNYIQGDININGHRTADSGWSGDYPLLCIDENSIQGEYNNCSP